MKELWNVILKLYEIMNNSLNEIKSLLGRMFVLALIVIVGIVAPALLIVIVPFAIYTYYSHKRKLDEINRLIDSELEGKTEMQIEEFRIRMLSICNNPNSTSVERDNALYAVKYIENKYYNKK